MEFKNALLETFPHLQGKLGTTAGGSAPSPLLHHHQQSPRSASASTRTSTSTLRGSGDAIAAGGDGTESQESPRGAAGGGGHHHHHLPRAGPVRTDNVSDETPGSWNATLPRGPKARTVRKSPEGSSNVVDSGFSTEAKDVSSGARYGETKSHFLPSLNKLLL